MLTKLAAFQACFEEYDLDGSGKLDAEELRCLLASLTGQPVEEIAVEDVVSAATGLTDLRQPTNLQVVLGRPRLCDEPTWATRTD